MTGEIGILNVGAGDDKLVFDPKDPKSMARGARVVTDMLRRGYALLIEVPDGKGGTKTRRVKKFHPSKHEYIIDEVPEEPGMSEKPNVEKTSGTGRAKARRRGTSERSVPAAGTRGVAVSRIAGG